MGPYPATSCERRRLCLQPACSGYSTVAARYGRAAAASRSIPRLTESSMSSRFVPRRRSVAWLVAFFLLIDVAAQGWTSATVAARPPGRSGAGLAYDSARQVAVLFSGVQTLRSPPPLPLRDTWEWNGSTWTQSNPTNAPSARLHAAMAYDPVRRRVVLFGGLDANSGAWLADTWEYDGTNWRQITTAIAPTPRRTTLTWDAGRQRVLLHGGSQDLINGPFFADTWEFDGVTWRPVTSALQPPAGPPVALCHDAARGVIVALVQIAAWSPTRETWELAAGQWRRVATVRTPRAGVGTMAFDAARRVCVYFDTVRSRDPVSTWEYDGTSWFETTSSLRPRAFVGGATPLVWDARLRTTLCFGGDPILGLSSDDTWSYAPPRSYAAYDHFGAACPGPRGNPVWQEDSMPYVGLSLQGMIFNLSSNARPVYLGFGVSDQSWNGVPLPLSLGFVGMAPACQAWTAPVVFLRFVSSFGIVFVDLPVPADPSLIGGVFFNQVWMVDPQAPGGVGAVTDAQRAVVGG